MKPVFIPDRENFESRLIPEPNTGCWIWLNRLFPTGYGQLCKKIDRKQYAYRAHRVAWELYKGPIPTGLVVDHICRNRWCVNPNHMELVTQRENTIRGEGFPAQRHKQTHCINGHLLSGENVYWYRGYRQCIPCSRARDKIRRRNNEFSEA